MWLFLSIDHWIMNVNLFLKGYISGFWLWQMVRGNMTWRCGKDEVHVKYTAGKTCARAACLPLERGRGLWKVRRWSRKKEIWYQTLICVTYSLDRPICQIHTFCPWMTQRWIRLQGTIWLCAKRESYMDLYAKIIFITKHFHILAPFFSILRRWKVKYFDQTNWWAHGLVVLSNTIREYIIQQDYSLYTTERQFI